jgi:hypothetical protein
MFKKTIVACLAAFAVALTLPFCYGLWNENLTVGARITLATPAPEVSPDAEPAGLAAGDAAEESGEAEELPQPSEALTDGDLGIPDNETAGPAPEAVSDPADDGGVLGTADEASDPAGEQPDTDAATGGAADGPAH